MGLTTNKNMHVFNHTCIGASHIKNGIVCQDASISYSDESCNIIIVSDGHGSPKYFRSHKGSAYAVEVALTQIKRFVKEYIPKLQIDFVQRSTLYDQDNENLPLSDQENMVENVLRRLCSSIVSEWYIKIENDWVANPPTDEEMANIPEEAKEMFKSGSNMAKAYGATLIAFAQTTTYWLAIHLGDGKCIAFSKDGGWTEPIPWDPKCFLNITTSLSDEHPEGYFRFCMGGPSSFPEAIFIGSDGIDDSYPPIERLATFYGLMIRLAAKNGFEAIENDIRDFLPRLSAQGSKDDMSVAYWINVDSIYDLAIAIATRTIGEKQAKIESLQNKGNLASEQIQQIETEKIILIQELESYNQAINELSAKVALASKEEENRSTKNSPIQNIIHTMKTKINKFIQRVRLLSQR